LKAKEGLALISANEVTMDHGSLVPADVAELLHDQAIISVGNLDVVTLVGVFDLLRVAVAQVIHLANERIQKHLWSQFSGLPPGLAVSDGDKGLRPLGYTSASLAAEARVLANPVSLDYWGQIAEGFEDHASMAPLGVRKTEELLSIARRTAALELTVASRAIDLHGGPLLGVGTRIARYIAREYATTDLEER
jgi:histidine ammonia-lyase